MMNLFVAMARLTRDPETSYGGANNTAIARFGIAVDRRYKRDGQPSADFFNVTAFGRTAEFVEKYLRKGTKILLQGEMQNDNYTNREGKMVYGFQVIANNIEFAESKAAASQNGGGASQSAPAQGAAGNFNAAPPADGGFMDIPDGIDDDFDGIPFA